MKILPDIIYQYLKEQKILIRGNLYLVGVSGGPDSMALLSILNQIHLKLGIRLAVVHFNHLLRSSAIKDEKLVRKFCTDYNIQFYCKHRTLKKNVNKISEDMARKLRYIFFTEMVQELGASGVFLAHHENDLAETVLMKLLRGSGLHGLRGILPVSILNKVLYIRPLLRINKNELISYLKSKRIKFGIDETNHSDKFLRNKIRLKLIPLLAKEYNPDINKILLDLSNISIQDYDYLIRMTEVSFNKLSIRTKNSIKFNIKAFKSMHVSIQRMILRKSFELLVGNLNQLTFTHIHLPLNALNEKKINFLLNLPQMIQIRINKDFITLTKVDIKLGS